MKWFVTHRIGCLGCTIKIERDLINAFMLIWNRLQALSIICLGKRKFQ